MSALSPATPSSTRLEVSLSAHISNLNYFPVMGRRTVYAALTVGRKTFWIQRWATESCLSKTPFAFSADRLMCWTAGAR